MESGSPETNWRRAQERREHRLPPRIPDHEILRRIGHGAYGEVWLARNVMGVLRAVKVLHRADFEDSRPYDREFQGIRKFEPISRTHENLVDVLQVGQDESGGIFYYVMELADSDSDTSKTSTVATNGPDNYTPRTLRAVIRRAGRLSTPQCLDIAISLTSALEYLHRQGLVHRDIKPSNIILVGGVPKLADIGLVTGPADAKSFVGTEGFIPPEGPGSVAADIYSLGKVLYEASTGKDRHHFPEPPTRLGELTDREEFLELSEVLERSCSKDPAHRYASAGQMHAELILLQRGVSVRKLHQTEQRLAILKRVTVVAVAAVLVATALFLFQKAQSRRLEKLSRESRERLIRLNVTQGVRNMDEGDYATSLVWFTEALKLAKDDPEEESMHRYRIAAVMRQCPRLLQCGAHTAAINWAEFSSDGRRLLTASDDHTACVWDLSNGTVIHRLAHEDAVKYASFAPHGSRIITACEDGTAILWDGEVGKLVGTPMKHAGALIHAAFDSSGKKVVTSSSDGTVRVWNSETGAALSPFLVHTGRMNYAEFSGDGRLLVTASDDRTARLWRTDDWTPACAPLLHPDHVRHASFDAANGQIVTACRDRTVRVWSVAMGEQVLGPLKQSVPVSHASFSRDGRRILSAGGAYGVSGEVCLWDARTGDQLVPAMRTSAPVRRASFSPDERWIVAPCNDGTSRIWDARNGEQTQPMLKHNHSVWVASFSPDGRRLLTAGRDFAWRLWDLATDVSLDTILNHGDEVRRAEISPDGRLALTTGHGKETRLWDLPSGKASFPSLHHEADVNFATFSRDGNRILTASFDGTARVWDAVSRQPIGQAMAHPSCVFQAAFSPDGQLVITAGCEGTARIWSATTGLPVSESLTNSYSVSFASFSPDGRYAISCSGGNGMSLKGEARLWSVATGKLAVEPMLLDGHSFSAAFSPDGLRVVTGCGDDSIAPHAARIWDVRTGKEIGPLLSHRDGIERVAFSSNGWWIATASEDGDARVWNSTNGVPVTGWLKHGRGIHGLEFAPDCRRLATASFDRTARVWDAANGEPLTPPLRHNNRLHVACFSRDGSKLITASADGTARVWDLSASQEPIDALELYAQLLAGVRIDGNGGVTAIPPDELCTMLNLLKEKHQRFFAMTSTAGGRGEIWHERQAQMCELAKEWEAALFHVNRLLELHPNDAALLNQQRDLKRGSLEAAAK